jgi:TolB protein
VAFTLLASTATPHEQRNGVDTTLNLIRSGFVFSSDREGNTEIYAVEGLLGEPRNLSKHPAFDGSPRWSPDGGRIAFVSDRDGNREVYVMAADGSSQINITTKDGDDSQPAWSPDGRWIAYVTGDAERSGRAEGEGIAVISVIGADGRPRRHRGELGRGQTPTWSPDGRRLAFSRLTAKGAAIYTMRVDGSDLRTLTSGEFYDVGPSYGSNGEEIVYESRRHDRRLLVVMKADGSHSRVVRTPHDAALPRWSPSLPLICFTVRTDNHDDVFAVSLDGALQAALTRDPANDRSCDWLPRHHLSP